MGLELDELIYTRVVKYFKHRKNNNPQLLERQATLEGLRPALTLIARAITGKAIDIFPAEKEGGFKNDNFFLPVSIALFPAKEDNRDFYFYRLLYLCTQYSLGLNWKYDETSSSAATVFSMVSILSSTGVFILPEKFLCGSFSFW